MAVATNIVNGIPFPVLVDQAKYDALVDFPIRSDDFFLTTHIKSGTTWLQQISKLIKIKGEKSSTHDEDKHIFETCPWFEVIGKEAAMVSGSVESWILSMVEFQQRIVVFHLWLRLNLRVCHVNGKLPKINFADFNFHNVVLY